MFYSVTMCVSWEHPLYHRYRRSCIFAERMKELISQHGEAVESVEEAVRVAEEIGYPVMVRAATLWVDKVPDLPNAVKTLNAL